MNSTSTRAPRRTSVVCAIALTACAAEGTKTGNGVHLEFAATESPLLSGSDAGSESREAGADAGLSASETPFRLDAAWLRISEFALRAETDLCTTVPTRADVECFEGRIRVRRAVDLDLLHPQASLLETYLFPAAVYSRVDIRFDDQGETLGGVERASFVVSGTLVGAHAGERFVIASRRNNELRFENASGVDVLPEQWLSAQVDISRWLGGLPLLACIESGEVATVDGAWLIDDSTNCGDFARLAFEELSASTRLNKKER